MLPRHRSLTLPWNCRSVTVLTALRSWLIEQHKNAIHLSLYGMACGAGDAFVTAFERELRCLVVEEGRLPLVRAVASGTIGSSRTELIRMWVLVTIPAIDGGIRKIDVTHRQFQIRRLVAINACHRSMRAYQRKLCLSVIKA